MRRSKEIMVLIALFAGMAAFVLWYVIDRRAKNRATARPAAVAPVPAATRTLAPEPPPVDLVKTDGKTVDFSSGQPVVKKSAEDQTAIDAALKDMADATKDVTFEAPKKPAEPPPEKK